MEDLFYGLDGWERLKSSIDEVIDEVLEDACEKVGEDLAAICSRITWPIRVLVYKKAEIESAEYLGKKALDLLLEFLDENYGDPDGGGPDGPTDGMIQAAIDLGKVVRDEYTPWTCEPTGEVMEVTRDSVCNRKEFV